MAAHVGRNPRPGLLAAGFAALLLAWMMGSPLLSVPDERTHYYKALGAAYVQWSGTPAVVATGEMTRHDRFLAEMTRNFHLPAQYALQNGAPGQGLECVTFPSPDSAACQDDPSPPAVSTPVYLPGGWDAEPPTGPPPISGVFPSYVGAYPPYVYLPPGWAARLVGGGISGLWAARVASALLSLVLLTGAARCCRERAAAVGLLTAVTPMTLFLSAAVNTSGSEISAAVCALAAALALTRGDERRETWAWLAGGCAVLATSRVLGPVWVAAVVLLLCALLGWRRVASLARAHPPEAAVTAIVVTVAVSATLVWNIMVLPRIHVDLGDIRAAAGPALGNLPERVRESIGVFGWLDTPMPGPFYRTAAAALLVLAGLALWAASWRQRFLLLVAAATVAVTTIAVEAVTQTPFGFVSQGRYTLALAVAVPLLSGHVLAQRGSRLPSWGREIGLSAVTLSAVAVQLGGWYAQAHHYAVGLAGPRLFVLAPQWQPPGGWLLWLGYATAGTALLLLAGLMGDHGDRGSR